MPAIQFIGRGDVVDAVRARGLETWGIFQSRQFIVAGEGYDALDQFLERLEPGGSAAVYTLKVYKDTDPEEVTDKTECHGSFNFKLSEARLTPRGGVSDEVLKRLDRLEGLSDDDNSPTLTDILIGYLEDPTKLATIIGAFRNRLTVEPGAVGAVEQRRESPAFGVGPPTVDESRMHRIAAALDRLEHADPKILEHLEKLANLAATKPDFFKLVITQLDAL